MGFFPMPGKGVNLETIASSRFAKDLRFDPILSYIIYMIWFGLPVVKSDSDLIWINNENCDLATTVQVTPQAEHNQFEEEQL